MGILGLGRGLLLTFAIIFALAILKKLIIVFGLFFAIVKFGIVIVFIGLMISILVAMFRGHNGSKTSSAS
jgi:hypothetical protein